MYMYSVYMCMCTMGYLHNTHTCMCMLMCIHVCVPSLYACVNPICTCIVCVGGVGAGILEGLTHVFPPVTCTCIHVYTECQIMKIHE